MVNVNMRSSRPTKSDVADEPESNSIRGRKIRENQAKLRALKKPGVRVVPAEDHPVAQRRANPQAHHPRAQRRALPHQRQHRVAKRSLHPAPHP